MSNENGLSDQEIFENIKDLLNAFISSIPDDYEMFELSDEAKTFLNRFSENYSENYFGTKSKDFFVFFNSIYNQLLSELFNTSNKDLLLKGFSVELVHTFIALITDYLKNDKTFTEDLSNIEFVLNSFANNMFHDQLLCKYEEELIGGTSQLFKAYESHIADNLRHSNQQYQKLLLDFDDAYNDLLQKSDNVEKSSTERSIAILGVFSAIVLVFNAAVSFYTSIIEAFSTASIYRIVLVLLIVGFIFAGVMISLIYYLEKIRNSTSGISAIKTVKARNSTSETSAIKNNNRLGDDNNDTTIESHTAPTEKKDHILTTFIITISIIIISFLFLVCFWWQGFVERRNNKDFSSKSVETTVVTDNLNANTTIITEE